MKPNPTFALLALGASLATASSKAETLSNFYSGDHVHSYVSPYLDVKVGIQAGPNNTISADQSSRTNIFAVSQFGANNEALVGQVGETNRARVNQNGINNFAATGQIGYTNKSRIRQTGPFDYAIVDQIAARRNDAHITQIYHLVGFPSAP